MYRLMIVDDEFNIRDGIANAIPWSEHGVEIAGEATNGAEALEIIDKTKPDIVITDIYMDNMNGLEFAEKLKKKHPEIKIIILSGYDEFEHAKRAIELKVFSYLLKPVLPEELLKIVEEVIEEIEEDRKVKEKIRCLEEELNYNNILLQDRFLSDLFEGRIAGEKEILGRADVLGVNVSQPHYACLVFDMDGYYELAFAKTPKQMHMLTLGIKKIVYEVLGRHYTIYTVMHNLRNIIALVGNISGDNGRSQEELYEYIEKARENITNMLGITVTVGSSRIYNEITDIRKAYAEALRALDYKLTVGKDCIINIDDIVSISGRNGVYPSEEETRLLDSLNDDEDRVRAAIEDFFSNLQNQNYSKERLRAIIMQLFAVTARKFMDMGIDMYYLYDKKLVDTYTVLERYDTLDEIQNWMTNIVVGGVQQLQQERKNNVKSVIKKAQDYIMQNYPNPDISLNSIAKYVYLNPTYFSKLYKKETGESYIEFITNVRMEEAKRLIRESNAKIADIGCAVGYQNAQYFCTLFKKMTGVSPAEYRENNLV